jgi:hypothetical protein
MTRWVLIIGIVLILSAGCAVRVADFTVVSIKSSSIPAKSIGKRVNGESCTFSWFGISWLGKDPNLKDAIDKAMESAGPDYDAMVDTTVYRTNGFLQNCYTVKGTVISTKK